MAEGQCNFLVDGFPRNQDNVDGWERVIGDWARVPLMLVFTCSEEVMEKRLIKRGEYSGRSDDNIKTIRKRFVTFRDKFVKPVLPQYREKGIVREIDAGRSKEVYKETRAVIKKILGKENWSVGDRVEVLYSATSEWSSAMITTVHDDSTYDCLWDDGGRATRAQPLNIRHPGGSKEFDEDSHEYSTESAKRLDPPFATQERRNSNVVG